MSLDLSSLFAPRSVAIVGASDRNFIARGTYEGMRAFGFTGPVYPVNPGRDQVFGLPAYPDLAAIPERVDLAVIVVNAATAVDAVERCVDLGIPNALVMATGFAEAGAAGQALVERLRAAHRAGTQVCGPGTFGLVSVPARFSAYISPIPADLTPAPIAVATQSGSLVNMIITLGHERGSGFTNLVAAGSEAGLTLSDYFAWFVEDPVTRVLAAVAEEFRDPAGLIAVAERAASLGKPIVVLKLGRSAQGQRASAAHTGALVGSSDVHEAAFRFYGIHSVTNLDEFIETAVLLSRVAPPGGRRVGVVSISGGDCVLTTDLASRVGVCLPPFTETTQQRFAELVPDLGYRENPVDLGMRPLWQPGLLGECVRVAAADTGIDLVAVRLPPTDVAFSEVAAVAADQPKPVLAFTRATQALSPGIRAESQRSGVPVLQEIETALRAIRHLTDRPGFAERRRRRAALGVRPGPPPPVRDAAPGETLDEVTVRKLIAGYGLPVTQDQVVTSAEAAVAAAAALGGPVAMKLLGPGLLHRSDVGAVRLAVEGADAIARTYEDLAELATRLGLPPGWAVLVQEMAQPGVELVLGMLNDATWGPVVVFGAGGILVEALHAVAYRLPPILPDEAQEMIAESRADRLLGPLRGRPGVELARVAEVIVAFSRFCIEVGPWLEAVDINPFVACPVWKDSRVVDAVAIRGSRPA